MGRRVPRGRASAGPPGPRPDQGTGEVVLRRASAADTAAIAAIHLAARRRAMPDLAELHDEAEVRAWIGGTLLRQAEVWVALMAGEVAGYMALRARELEHLYVAPACQGRGLGGLLLSKAKALSPERLELYAFQRNRRARAFYEARGFVAIATSDGAGNEEREPDVRYRWPGAA